MVKNCQVIDRKREEFRGTTPKNDQTEHRKISFFIDFKASIMKHNVEDIVFDTEERISRISSLVPNTNPMAEWDVRRKRKDLLPRYLSANQREFESASTLQIHGLSSKYYENHCRSLARYGHQNSEFECVTDTGHIKLGILPSRADNKDDTIQNLVSSCKTQSMKSLKDLGEGTLKDRNWERIEE